MMKRKLKAITVEFIRPVKTTMLVGGFKEGIDFEKKERMSGVPTAKIIQIGKNLYEAFDMVIASGWVIMNLYYQDVRIVDAKSQTK